MVRYEAHRQGHSECPPAPTGSGSRGAGANGAADGTAGWVSPSAGQVGPGALGGADLVLHRNLTVCKAYPCLGSFPLARGCYVLTSAVRRGRPREVTGPRGPMDCAASASCRPGSTHCLSSPQQWPECGPHKAHRAPWGLAFPHVRSCVAALVVHCERPRLSGNDSHPCAARRQNCVCPRGPFLCFARGSVSEFGAGSG